MANKLRFEVSKAVSLQI